MVFSLFGDSGDTGVLSLLGNIASAGRLGQPDQRVFGMDEQGNPLPNQMSASQTNSAIDALLAFGTAAANASAPRFGPAPTLMQGLTEALGAGRQQLVNEQVAQQAMLELGLRRQILQRQLEGQSAIAQFLTRGAPQQPGVSDVTSQPGTPPVGYTPGSTVREALGAAEGGARGYNATNAGGYSGRYQLGAGLLADSGLYTPAEGENANANQWAGTFKIPGFEQVKTRSDFLANPAAQDAAYGVAMDHNDKQLQALGLYDGPNAAIGRTIAGVPVTREGLLAGAWLAGPGGVKAWVDSGGKVDRADANGTKVSQYVALGAPAKGPAAQPAPGSYQVASNQPVPPPSQSPGSQPPPAAPPAAPGTQPSAPGVGGATVAYPGRPDVAVAPGAAAPPAGPGATTAPQPLPPTPAVPPGAVAPPAPAGGATPGQPAVPVRAATAPGGPPGSGPTQPIVMPAVPGMNRSALDSMTPRDRQLLGATLLSMPPDKWQGVMAQLATRPGEAPQLTTIGNRQIALYRDGTRVDLGPTHQEPFQVDRLDNNGAVHTFRIDPNAGTEQDLGVKSMPTLESFKSPEDGQNYLGYRGPDGSMHAVAPAPVPPSSQPLTAERMAQEMQLHPDYRTMNIGGQNYLVQTHPGGGYTVIGQAALEPGQLPKTPEAQRQDIERAQAALLTPERAFATDAAKSEAEQAKDTIAAGAKSIEALQKIRAFQAFSKQFEGGALAGAQAKVGALANAVGVNLGSILPGTSPDQVVDAQVLSKFGNGLAMSLIGTGGMPANNFSEADRNFLVATVPNISQMPRSREIIARFMEQGTQNALEKSIAWQRIAAGTAPEDQLKAWRTFNADWMSRQAANPIVKSVKQPSDLEQYPSGTIYVAPDGVARVKP